MNLPINHSPEPRNLIPCLAACLDQAQPVALLTLVDIEGSSPYPVGAHMLVQSSGEYLGQITGGCAERALADQAVSAMNQQQNQLHRYGLDSPFFDIQLPCGSGVDVFFEVGTALAEYRALAAELAARCAVERVFKADGKNFNLRFLPNERLLILGQSAIVQALANSALLAGFEVSIVVQDQAEVARLAGQNLLAVTQTELKVEELEEVDGYTAVVSLFHEHERETHLLQAALHSNAFYIGALGSRRTHAQRLENLRSLGFADTDLSRISGPVGLDIGAQSPAQIAISIMAELVQKMPRTSGTAA